MSRWWLKPGVFTKAGSVTVQRPGEEPYEVPAYTYGEFRKILAGGRVLLQAVTDEDVAERGAASGRGG